MAYREELQTLRARVEQLESELAGSQEALQRYRDNELSARGKAHILLGGPTVLTFEQELAGELDEDGLEQLVGELRRELGELGRTEKIGGTLAWGTTGRSNRLVEVTCEVRAGRTRIRIHEPLRQLAGSMFGGIGGGVGGGGMGLVVPLVMRFGSAMLPLFMACWLLGVYALVRSLYARTTTKRALQLQGLLDKVTEQARGSLAARVRIVSEQGGASQGDAQGDAEHEAEDEAELEQQAEREARG